MLGIFNLRPSPPREAPSGTVKQSRKASPEVQREKVLLYLESHQDVPINHEDIARGSGLKNRSKAAKVIRELVDEGTVVRSASNRHGTRYWINSSIPNAVGKNTDVSLTGGGEDNDIDFVKTNEELIFKFIRATRSTDVLLYQTWLERGGQL